MLDFHTRSLSCGSYETTPEIFLGNTEDYLGSACEGELSVHLDSSPTTHLDTPWQQQGLCMASVRLHENETPFIITEPCLQGVS